MAAVLLLGACSSGGDEEAGPSTTVPAGTSTGTGTDGGETPEEIGDGVGARLRVRLSEGEGSTPAALTQVEGTPLTDDEIAAVLGRLEPWDLPDEEEPGFVRPPASRPAPLVGSTVSVPFPPVSSPGGPVEPGTRPLEVLRAQPDGEVDLAPFLSVTFNQPMVPVATLEQLAAEDVPVRLTPDLPGRWRWIGTRTLRFELEPGAIDRLPQATQYTAEIPAGTASASGATLGAAFRWTFATPAPRVEQLQLSESLPLTPVLVAVFDQRIDSSAVLATIRLEAAGTAVPLRLATAEEIAADQGAHGVAETALEGRWMAFRPVDPLPVDTPVTVVVGPGTPSAEGPRITEEAQRFTGRTYPPFRVLRTNCYDGGACAPGVPWNIEFSNPIDPASFRPAEVSASPALPGMRVGVFGQAMEIHGVAAGRTEYTVFLPAGLRDVFGQTLGEGVSVTVRVGAAPAELTQLGRQYVTVDPGLARPGLTITSVNHDRLRVRAWAVTPDDTRAFQEYLDRFYSDTDPAAPEWRQVLDTEVATSGRQDAAVETPIDLADAFAASGGPVVLQVEPTRSYPRGGDDWYRNRPVVVWVQATSLGVDALLVRDRLLVWVTDLLTGAPRGDVSVRGIGAGGTATTDAAGLAELVVAPGAKVRGVVATAGDDTSFLPSSWWEGWEAPRMDDETRWYVFDDRGVYKPGETVRMKGWVRTFSASTDSQLGLFAAGTEVEYRAYDPQGSELATGTATVNVAGGFVVTFDLADDVNLGPAYVELRLRGTAMPAGSSSYHSFQIQEYRTPEFEVVTRNDTPGPYYTTDPATVAARAGYYAGGVLRDADVNWSVTTSTTSYAPPGWDDFTFGIWRPWWFEGDAAVAPGGSAVDGIAEPCIDCPPGGETVVETFAGRTDANGEHFLRLDFEAPEVDQPSTVTAEAGVTDVNRQAWASRTNLLVHPSRFYVGLRTDRTFVEAGDPLVVEAIVTDVDGAAVAGRSVTVEAGRLEWVWEDGTWVEQVADTQTCRVDSTDEAVRCEFGTELGGSYRVTAVVNDDRGGRQRTQLTRWVSGGESRPSRTLTQQRVTIVPDAQEYQPDDEAELLVQAPFAPANGLMTVMRNGLVSYAAFDAPDGSAVLRVPVTDREIPNVVVQIDMVGATERTKDDGTPLAGAPPQPAFATGQITLRIPPVSRTLTVTPTPASPEVVPGAETSVSVAVTDAAGAPVSGAEVAIVVVDEAVLALSGYQLGDPIAQFYGEVPAYVMAEYLRNSVLLGLPEAFDQGDGADEDSSGGGEVPAAPTTTAPAEGALDGGATRQGSKQYAEDGTPIVVRQEFDALALFAPEALTGADGTVTVPVDLPDNLTRYRIMAVAVSGADRFGSGAANLTARLPLQVRPSAPRFANFGDAFELPVVVQNQTDTPFEVDVVVEADNATLTAGAGRRVAVPADDRVEVRFPVSTDAVGPMRFRAVVARVGGTDADAAAVELPVYTPATAEAFATYGVVDEGAITQPFLAPTGVFSQFGGLEVNTSSTAVQALTDAVLFLEQYPYDSVDAYASRIMAVAALRDVLDAFDAEGLPSPEAIDRAVRADVDKLVALQNDSGGFPYWRRGERDDAYVSVQATHALVLAREAGYAVPADPLARALEFVRGIEQAIPGEVGPEVRHAISAYALHVRALAGQRDPAKAEALYRDHHDEMQLDAIAWLWPVIDDAGIDAEIARLMENRAVETAGAATFATSYGETAYVIATSDRKVDGVVLDALLTQRPASDLIPKVVNGLLASQVKGRWRNVQENAFILLALHRYFQTFEAVTPDFVARVWLGDEYVAEHAYRGRTTDRDVTLVPMAELVGGGDEPIVLAKDGTGRLYYRLGLRYAPDDLTLAPRDEGFVVDRVYEAVGDAGDVRRDPDGTWHIRAGATVRVRLTMVADAQRAHVALVDPLPAGLEPLNSALSASVTPPPDRPLDPAELARTWCWCWRWYEHENLRDDRAEAFTSYLAAGTYEYTYTARATTPGTFVVPPARAEEMYSPEVFGRSGSTKVTVDAG
jgi:hypothetical protein